MNGNQMNNMDKVGMNRESWNKEQIAACLKAVDGLKADKGRLLFPDGVEAWRDRVMANPAIRQMAEEMKEEADRFLARPIPHLPWSLFRLFVDEGSRKPYETPYFEKRQRLTALAVTALLYPDQPVYREALYDAVWSVCDEYTWCLPAHLPAGFGSGAASWSPAQHVDLFAAETAFALAEITALMRPRMPERIVSRVHEEVHRRVLAPYMNLGPFGWETARHNWSAVCAGSIGAAAVYLLDDEERLADVLEKVLGSLACFLDGYGNDGVCTEGYGYWAYGFGFFVYVADLLKRRTGGAMDLFTWKKVDAVARFPQHCFMSGRMVANFSDALPEAAVDLGLFHYLHSLFPDVIVPDNRLRSPFKPDHCGRWAPAIRSIAWHRPDLAGKPWPPMSVFFPDAEWMLSRHAADGNTYFFAAKGGHNDEPHNHNDIGHFILHGNGETFLADMGAGLYTADYFGPKRYEILCNSSFGHSVPIIGGAGQKAGREYKAVVLDAVMGEKEDVFSLDLSAAYPESSLTRLMRTFIWCKSASPCLVLEDAYSFAGEPSGLTERFVTPFKPEPAGSGRIMLSGRGRLAVEYDASLAAPSVQTLEFIGHDGRKSMFYALDFAVKPAGRDGKIRFRFSFIP